MNYRLLVTLVALGGYGCDAGDFEGGASAADYDAGYAADAGAVGNDPGKQVCVVDDDCRSGEVCFAGECIFQGNAPPPATDAGMDDLPEEEEQQIAAFTVPAAGIEHVWVASPETDTLVRIHGETLALDAIEVGDEPTQVRAPADADLAVVLNRGSDELAIVRGPGDARFFPLPGHFNALTLSPDGGHALAWFDLGQARVGEIVSSLQDLVVLDLDDGELHTVTVGFRPQRIQFTADGATALVVTDDGISVFRPAELGDSTLARTVPVAPDVFGQAEREVVVSEDGAWAASRAPDEPGITVVDLSEGVPRFVPLDAIPTDVDLLPDGRTALVMLRVSARLALVPLETAADDPESIRFVDFEGHTLGAATVAGEFAVLYTTLQADQARPQISLLHLESTRIVHRPVRKAIAGVELAPNGRTAVILHHKTPGTPDPRQGEAEFLARSHGYSLLDVRTANVKLQTTQARPEGLVFSAERDEAFLILRDTGVAAVQRIDLNGFAVQAWELGTLPEVVGVLPALERAFVTQTHPEGRISFIRLEADPQDGGRLETVSGYALNGRID